MHVSPLMHEMEEDDDDGEYACMHD